MAQADVAMYASKRQHLGLTGAVFRDTSASRPCQVGEASAASGLSVTTFRAARASDVVSWRQNWSSMHSLTRAATSASIPAEPVPDIDDGYWL